MDTVRSWLYDKKRTLDLRRLAASIDFNDPHVIRLAQEALVAGVFLVILVYVVQALSKSRKSNQSWLRFMRRDSRDPEKNDDPGRYAVQKMKPASRKPGSKSISEPLSLAFVVNDKRMN